MQKTTKMYDYESIFPQRLRALMKEGNVTQRKIAEICSVKPQSVSQWYNGDTRPDILSLAEMALFFNVSTDYLLGLTDYKTTDRATKELCDTLRLSETAVALLQGSYHLDFLGEDAADQIVWRDCVAQNVADVFNMLAEEYAQQFPREVVTEKYREQSFIELFNLFADHLSADNNSPLRFSYLSEDKKIERVRVLPNEVLFETKTDDGSYTVYNANIQKLMIDSIINDITAKLHDKKREALSRDAKARAEREGETQ